MTRTKLTPINKMKGNPCLNCPDPQSVLSPEHIIAVGFGDARLVCDGKTIWDENHDGRYLEFKDMMSVAQAEEMAATDPDHDWRIILHGPMHGETYQRQDGQWVCVEQNQGFA